MRAELQIPLLLSEISSAVNGKISCDNQTVECISTDTRDISAGEVFFALSGKNFSGNDFLEEAKKKGAITVAACEDADIVVKSSDSALLDLAAYYKAKLPCLKHIVAITGSVGKTTTKEFLASALGFCFKTHKSFGNFNNGVGLPLSILSAPKNTEILVLEMGMNRKGEISSLSKCAEPSIGIITNVGTSHIGNFGSRRGIAEAKLEILDGLRGPLIIPAGEALLDVCGALTFSKENRDANLFVECFKNRDRGYTCQVYDNGSPTKIRFSVDALHLVDCIAPIFLIFKLLDIDVNSINHDFFNIFGENHRQKIVPTKDFYILCDFYNASKESFRSGFEYVSSLSGYTCRSALAGDILELGNMSEDTHFDIGAMAANYGFEKLYAFGNYAEAFYSGAVEAGFPKENIFVNTDISAPEVTAEAIIENHIPGEIIFFKASHALRLDRILSMLEN